MDAKSDTIRALEITVAVLDNRMSATEAALGVLDERLARVEVAVVDLKTTLARWGGVLLAFNCIIPFVAAHLM